MDGQSLRFQIDFTLMRHAEAVKNVGSIHGGGDQTLTATGLAQAAEAGLSWRICLRGELGSFLLVHQPEGRSRHTAEIIAELVGTNAIEIADLAGVNLGVTSGLSDAELADQYPEISAELVAWKSGCRRTPPKMPGSEGLDDFAARVSRGIRQIVGLGPAVQRVLFVATTSTLNMTTHLLRHGGRLRRPSYDFITLPLAGADTLRLAIANETSPDGRTQGWSVLE